MVGLSRFCTHGNLRASCKQCKAETLEQAQQRAAENRARGEVGRHERMEEPVLHYPWQRGAFDAWTQGGRSGLVALSLGLPTGDLPYAVMADQVNANPSTNVLFACATGETEGVAAALRDRFGRSPTTLADHHHLEPREDGVLLVADLEELQTVDLSAWGRFATNGLLVLLDADGVGSYLGDRLLDAPFRSRFCLSRQPSAIDLLVSRPWTRAFGPLLYRYTEDQARDVGILPRIEYRLHVEMLRPDKGGDGLEGPWPATEIPTRLPAFHPGAFMKGKARDVATARCSEEEGLVVVADGVPVKGAMVTVSMREVPETYAVPPKGWILASPAEDLRAILRLATVAYKTLGRPGRVEDAVVLPVPADLCRIPPWDDRWRAAAVQIDRVAAGLLLAEDARTALSTEDLEALVGVALSLRGIPAEELHNLTPVVARAAAIAHAGSKVEPQEVRDAARAFGGLAPSLLVAAELGALHLLRIAHPRVTPDPPDLPHPSLYDARRHAWRGRAFHALAQAANKDLVTAWGRYPELRFVFRSSTLLEAATAYCKRHRLLGPLDEADLKRVEDHTRIQEGDRAAAGEVLQEWRDALRIAEGHEREYLRDMHARQPERERRREGMALPGLRVVNRSSDTVTLEPEGARLPATNIAVGSEVALVEQGGRKELGRGTVAKMDSRRLTIEFPDGAPGRLPRAVTVNLTFDAKVFEAYHAAVLGAMRALQATTPQDDGPDGLLRAALLGETEPPASAAQALDVPGLTPSQREAIETVLSGGRVHLVHGPPGTGKTHTLVHLAMALTRAGHSVLVTADSNAAVDNLVVGLRRNGAPVVRVGHAPNLRDEAAEPARIDPVDAPGFVRWAAGQGIVVATTNYGAFRYIDAKGSMSPFLFDYVIHDEAGQATAPSSLAAVMRGRRLVLAGDPLQLPPTVVSLDAKEAGLDVTLFERIEALTGKGRTRLLATQFRMREPIVAFSNARYYDGRIETDASAAAQEGLPDIPPVAFQHVTGRENARQRNGSISNDFEVDAVGFLVEKYRSEIRDHGWTVAVLTPYQAQREALRRRLPDVEVSTVDGAQGREWDIVFYSSVRSNPRHRLGFLSDERRLNVAVTRARRNFILVGDERTLRSHDGFSQLLDGAQKIRMYWPDQDPKAKARHGGTGARGRTGQDDKRRKEGKGSGDKGSSKRRRRRRRGKAGMEGQKEGGSGGSDRDDLQDRAEQAGPHASGPDGQGGPKRRGRGRRVRRTDGGQGASSGKNRGPGDEKPEKTPRKGGPAGQGAGNGEDPRASGRTAARRPVSAKPTATRSAKAPQPCAATTKAGASCRNKARPGSRFCGRHGG